MNRLKYILSIFLLWTLYGSISKVLFLAAHHRLLAGTSLSDWLGVCWHGLPLDLAMAGYLTAVPALLAIVSLWYNGLLLRWTSKIYFGLTTLIVAFAFVLNIGLYSYWGFPLDTTPLFYFTSSPADALASASWWEYLAALLAVGFLSASMNLPLSRCRALLSHGSTHRITESLLCLLAAGALFIPIRGGFGVSVNNVGKVYFSRNIRLNHAAVNPVFSFVDSATMNDQFDQQYRFMADDEATGLLAGLCHTTLRTDSLHRIADTQGTRIVMVILESFSSYLLTEQGHVEGVTPTLDSLSQEGLFFENFYANSFRTDRGLISILSGYPAQPCTSLMKYPHKTNNLESIARSLREDGYATRYVYGGDANFTDMRSYLMATGFEHITSEDDFPKEQRTGKWGVNDGYLFDKALAEMGEWTPESKQLMVIQTSSSHEPFDVPVRILEHDALNAFHYTDDCLGRFVSQMRQRPDWQETLLVIVPDHLGCYPEPFDNYQLGRYHIPLLILGGKIPAAERISTYASQQDLAATLLGMLGIGHGEFPFSKDILDPAAPHFAFFTHPNLMGMATADNDVIYDNDAQQVVLGDETLLPQAKAYLQKLFDDLASR